MYTINKSAREKSGNLFYDPRILYSERRDE